MHILCTRILAKIMKMFYHMGQITFIDFVSLNIQQKPHFRVNSCMHGNRIACVVFRRI